MKKTLTSLTVLLLASTMLLGCATDATTTTGTNDTADANGTMITLGEEITTTGTGVTLQDNLILIESGGTYTISGTLTDGQLCVVAPEAVTLTLADAHITNSQGPAILFRQDIPGEIHLATATENTLTDGPHDTYDGALYSTSSLTIDGDGTLTINGTHQEGIAVEEHLTINDGILDVTAIDDGLNANQDGVSIITINGGTLYVQADGDGIDSNGSIIVNGGTVISYSPTSDMSGGIDCDGDFIINGGTLLATGANNTQPATSSTQASLSFDFKTTQTADTLFQLLSGEQSLLIASPAKEYQTLLYSSDRIDQEGSYSVYSGGTCDGIATNGIYPTGTITDATQQTHRNATTAGEFIATGLASRFMSVTYLTDTDFSDTMTQRHRPSNAQPPTDQPRPQRPTTPPNQTNDSTTTN